MEELALKRIPDNIMDALRIVSAALRRGTVK